jgi:hypothetical protein
MTRHIHSSCSVWVTLLAYVCRELNEKERIEMEKQFKIGSVNGVEIAAVDVALVLGVAKVSFECELGAVMEALASKTENKIDDAIAAIARKALSNLTKEIASTDIGTIHGHAISHMSVGIVSGKAKVDFDCNIATTAEELAALTPNKIDDLIVTIIAEILKRL